MCGIAGLYRFGANAPTLNREELARISASQSTRGPDANGVWYTSDERLGLAHRRLAIIDLHSAANQPFCVPDGSYCIVFNGEIYNYRALREMLEVAGYSFATASDTEVLLCAYREWGESVVDYLRGMFAFAIWEQSSQRLFLARDPYGIKPLYYASDGRTFRFASQVKALLAGGAISREV